MSPTNEDLIERWRGGDAAAFDELYRRCVGLRKRAAWLYARHARDQAAVDSTVNEAFYTAAKHCDPSRGAFTTLFMRCAFNALNRDLQYWRTQNRDRSRVTSLVADRTDDGLRLCDALAGPDRRPCAIAAENEELAGLRATLAARTRRMPPREQEIVELLLLDFTQVEIGEALGFGRERARQLVDRTITWLRMDDDEWAVECTRRRSLGARVGYYGRHGKPTAEPVA